jgi:choline dehydrogenase-like flavoprotein
MLSGVGPAPALRDAGIDVVVDAPGVGANLQDHPAALAAWSLKASAGAISVTDDLMHSDGRLRLRALAAYALARRGPLATTGCDRGAFVATTGRGDPDLQIRLAPGLALNPDGISSYVEFGRLAESGQKWPSGVTMQLLGVRPASRGRVTLASPDPWDAPSVDPGYLSDPAGADAATLRAGVRLAREIAGQAALAGLVDGEVHPGPDADTDAAIDDYVRRTLHSGNAVVGSAAMGAAGDPGAVVTPDLRVKGVAGLRVADASVCPRIPGGQTGAAVFVIAERAAALLGAPAPLVEGAEGGAVRGVPALAAA